MRSLDDETRKFKQVLQETEAAHRQRAAQDGGGPFLPPVPNLAGITDVEERLAAYDAWLEQRIAVFRGQLPAVQALPARQGTPSAPQPNAPAQEFFHGVDYAMLESFRLNRFALPAGMQNEVRVFSTPESFSAAVLQGWNLSHAEAQAIRETGLQPLRNLKAVYLPGQGCLVNASGLPGKGVAGAAGTSNPELQVLKAYTLTRWGQGFIAEYTRLGQDMVRDGIWPAWQAWQLGITLPRWQTRQEALKSFALSFSVAERGWCDWLWDFLAFKSFAPVSQGSETMKPARFSSHAISEFLKLAWKLFPFSLTLDNLTLKINDLAELVNYLFFEKNMPGPRMSNALIQLIEQDLQPAATMSSTERERFIGWMNWQFFSTLESRLGTYCVPYAVLIMFNCPGNAALLQLPDFQAYRQQNPSSIVDTRLLLLTRLDGGVRYDPHGWGSRPGNA